MGFNEFSFNIAVPWISKLYELLLKIRKERKTEIDYLSNVFGNPVELAKYYIEPDCQQFNPADDSQDDSNVIRQEVFNYLQDVFLGGYKSGGGKNQLFILSDAGMGKTSLLVMLKLAHITSFWPKGYECLLLKLSSSTIDDIRQIKGRQNHVLLLDALDEDPMSWKNIRKRIKEILNETKTFYRVIITCRTQFFTAKDDPFNRRGQVEVEDYLCPVIFLSLFSDKQVKKYLDKRFCIESSQKDNKKAETVYSIINKMGSLRCRPMLLAHAEDFMESENKNWSEYKVYDVLVRAWLLREKRKDIWQKMEKQPNIDILLSICKRVAGALQKSEKPFLDEPLLQSLIKKHPETDLLKLIDVEGRSLLNKNSEGNFRFSHYSIQEFLLVKGIIEGDFISRASIRCTNQMVRFAFSWIGDDDKKKNKFKWSVLQFDGISFEAKNFSFLNLRECDFKGFDFNDVDFSQSDMEYADIRGSNLSQSTLEGAKLYRTIVDTNTRFPSEFKIPDEVLRLQPKIALIDVDLSNIDFFGVNLSNSKIERVILNGANLQEANFGGATLVNVSLRDTNGSKSKFDGSNLINIDFYGSNLMNCNFKDACFNNVNFSNCKLNDSKFNSSSGDKISFNNSMLSNAQFYDISYKNDTWVGSVLWDDDEDRVSRR
ncbi:pentapeptide repeat-containing protein [bacterium]|nr:pentapeptide repeat-containing protein [bacterium]